MFNFTKLFSFSFQFWVLFLIWNSVAWWSGKRISDYVNMTVTTRTLTAHFEGLFLTSKKQSAEIKCVHIFNSKSFNFWLINDKIPCPRSWLRGHANFEYYKWISLQKRKVCDTVQVVPLRQKRFKKWFCTSFLNPNILYVCP